jgi:hypothetical protein
MHIPALRTTSGRYINGGGFSNSIGRIAGFVWIPPAREGENGLEDSTHSSYAVETMSEALLPED